MFWLLLIAAASNLMFIHSQDPVNGVWSPWGDWQECDVDCGSGWIQRFRACDNPAPENNGTDCAGQAVHRGQTCQVDCGCELGPCENNADCVQNITDAHDYTCNCTGSWYGQNCTECGEERGLSSSSSEVWNISSLAYPQTYPNNSHCTWRVSTEPGATLQLTFNHFDVDSSGLDDCLADYNTNVKNYTTYDFFSEEDILSFCPCVYDMLIINTGLQTDPDNEVEVFCNEKPPAGVIAVDSHQMSLEFHTDPGFAGENKQGFHLTVTAVVPATITTASPCMDHLCLNNATCQALDTDYWCQCAQGFSGTFCQTDSSASRTFAALLNSLLSIFTLYGILH